MSLALKQLIKQVSRNKVFVLLLFFLTVLTSLSFFFVKFSIDGNMALLDSLPLLSGNQMNYKNALRSNTVLAYNFFVSMTGLTSFAFYMFFYRFFRSAKKTMGCLKALGFKDSVLSACFVLLVTALSTTGALTGLLGGYFLSAILIEANTKSYAVTGLVKGIHFKSLFTGLTASTYFYCVITIAAYSCIWGKEPAVLIGGKNNQPGHNLFLKIAGKIVNILPLRDKGPLRIALRKPLSILLIIIAASAFGVCFILGQSLNMSSKKVFDSQTVGHNYEFDTHYPNYLEIPTASDDLTYLFVSAELKAAGYGINQTVIGLYDLNKLYELMDDHGKLLSVPNVGTVCINPGLAEIYGVNIGDKLALSMGGQLYNFTVSDIALNAKSACIYVNGTELSAIMGVPAKSYNGIWSAHQAPDGGETISRAEYRDVLKRNAVSNKTSGVINQVTGILAGCILIFLALYLNFLDNTRDMLILHLMGYEPKEISNMLINIYWKIMTLVFVFTVIPSIFIAKSIQKSLSISTSDYMPFGTNLSVILFIFVLLNIIYGIVQTLFAIGIKRAIKQEAVFALITSE